jgi:hypothetical protein
LLDHVGKLFGAPFQYAAASDDWYDEQLDGKTVCERLYQPVHGDWHNSFEQLDRTVWIEAVRAGLSEWLPKESDDSSMSYLGKTKLPCFPNCRELGPPGRSVIAATWEQLCRWRDEITALCELAISAVRAPSDSPRSASAQLALDEEDVRILGALAKHPSRLLTQAQIAGHSEVSERTIFTRLPTLKKAQLVSQPRGKKSGHSITKFGIEKLAALVSQMDDKELDYLAKQLEIKKAAGTHREALARLVQSRITAAE